MSAEETCSGKAERISACLFIHVAVCLFASGGRGEIMR